MCLWMTGWGDDTATSENKIWISSDTGGGEEVDFTVKGVRWAGEGSSAEDDLRSGQGRSCGINSMHA